MENNELGFSATIINFMARSKGAYNHFMQDWYSISLAEVVEGDSNEQFATTLVGWVDNEDYNALDTYINYRDFPAKYSEEIEKTLDSEKKPHVYVFVTGEKHLAVYARAAATNGRYTAGNLYRVVASDQEGGGVWVYATGERDADIQNLVGHPATLRFMMESFPDLFDTVDEEELAEFRKLIEDL